MKTLAIIMLFLAAGILHAQSVQLQLEVQKASNALFTEDPYWRGADGAASIDMENGNILWLFSDSFIDTKGTGSRLNARMINNSIAIQEGISMDSARMSFYYKGKKRKPKAFFELPGKNWFWTGHGAMVNGQMVIFLFEEKAMHTGIGFEAIGWYIALIENPYDNPSDWHVRYLKGEDTFGVIVGSSAVLQDDTYLYAYGVQEPSSHEVYLLRIPIAELGKQKEVKVEWWNAGQWITWQDTSTPLTPLFIGQTEFSVHYDELLQQYIQVQIFGYGQAAIGYRLAPQPEGPRSEPVIFYQTTLQHPEEFVYSANAHPEVAGDGLLTTYNINNGDFKELMQNEEIYFPICLRLMLSK